MNTEKRFFAAANGYRGFRSYFAEIFNSRDYAKIFVLKGGPGTGKSSFMRRVATSLEEKGAECEYIYCSSDPFSLDGIICEKDNKRIAIIDGTAPHERDAIIPGAIDEIINLGQNWDSRWLFAEREKILTLNDEKKRAYATAYSYLKIAGNADIELKRILRGGYDAKKLKYEAKSLAESLKTVNKGNIKTRLISSFGKMGKYGFETLEVSAKKKYSVKGNDIFISDFLNYLQLELCYRDADIIICPSPLDENAIEAIYIPGEDILISASDDGENIIDTVSLVCENDKTAKEKTKVLNDIHSICLESSTRWFSIASDVHFRLEDIYKSCMDFEGNNRIINEKLEILCDILKL